MPDLQASDLLLDTEWANVPHVHTGFPATNHPINCSLQVLFHTPSFIRLLCELDHRCLPTDRNMCCYLLKIWESVRNGNVQREEIAEFSQLMPDSSAFDIIISIISELHYALAPVKSLDESPVLDIFGGRMETTRKCGDCGLGGVQSELLVCIQLSLVESENLQEVIDESFKSKRVPCPQCSSRSCNVYKEVIEAPKMLILHVVRASQRTEDKSFRVSPYVNIQNLIHYKVLGSVQHNNTAIVTCPNKNMVTISNRKVKSISLDRFCGTETGASCNLIICRIENEERYPELKNKEVATPINLRGQSTPISGSAHNNACQSTSRWSMSRIDSSKEGSLKPRRKLYADADTSDSHVASASSLNSKSCKSSSSIITSLHRSKMKGCNCYVSTIASYRKCVKDPIKFKFFCGLSPSNFQVLYNLLGGHKRIKQLKMKYLQRTPKRFMKGKLSSEDKLFMFLVRLRRGVPLIDLAYVFGIEKAQCGAVCYTMLRYLYLTFKGMEKYMFIGAEEQRKKKPLPFRPFKNLRVIIDGLEIFVDCPSNFQHQGNTYSEYKSHNTVRFIIGISCYGTLMFVSPGFEGNISEKQALKESGFYEHLEAGDVVMSDRGFDINDDLLRMGVELVKPPSLDGRKTFTPEEEIATRAIAAARIYVEHAVKLIKVNRLFKPCVPLTLLPTFSDYVYVAGALANFGTKSFKQGAKKKKGGQQTKQGNQGKQRN